MADHVRKQIRDGVVAALTGLPTTGARVSAERIYPTARAGLPGLQVVQGSESTAGASLPSPRYLQRVMRIEVRAIAQADDGVDDVLDQICAEVEEALAMPCAELAGLAKVITLVGTEFDFDRAAEQPTGQAAMSYEVQYITAEDAPDVAH